MLTRGPGLRIHLKASNGKGYKAKQGHMLTRMISLSTLILTECLNKKNVNKINELLLVLYKFYSWSGLKIKIGKRHVTVFGSR